jgi:hypothetical protein
MDKEWRDCGPIVRRDVPAPPPPPLSRMVRDGVLRWKCCPKCSSTMVFKWWIFGQAKCIHPECGYVAGSELPDVSTGMPMPKVMEPRRRNAELDGRNGNGYQPLHERYPNMPNVNPPPTCAKPLPPEPPPKKASVGDINDILVTLDRHGYKVVPKD